MSDEKIKQIKELLASGFSKKTIALMMGYSYSYIYNIIRTEIENKKKEI